jgi:hypothetical protein
MVVGNPPVMRKHIELAVGLPSLSYYFKIVLEILILNK